MLANIIYYAKNIAVSLVSILFCFGLLDFLWLSTMSEALYLVEMKNLLRNEFITWPWLLFYILYSGVLFVLAVVANRDKSALYAGIDGALLGLASYGAYNLTNYSIIEGFSLKIMLIDWGWGIVISSISAVAGWFGFRFQQK